MFTLDYILWIALIITACAFIFSGIDDLFFDIVYWGYFLVRKIKPDPRDHIGYETLLAIPEQKIALIIGCWQESNVIENMVRYNLSNIDYINFAIFIGVYPNDKETLREARRMEKTYNNVHCVINKTNGPTNKADNLNSIYQAITQFEKRKKELFSIIVMHDPEDLIHFLSFKLYNYLIPKAPMVQIPILPLEGKLQNAIYWSYCDEFAELHTKDLVVRELINGFVPSAGVGTGFDRHTLDLMSKNKNGLPFGTTTLTEDYSTSLQLHLLMQKVKEKRKPVFTMKYIERVQTCRPWFYFGKRKFKKTSSLVATRALFPQSYRAAVRQRSRWTLGIVFQEWKHTGWPGKLSTLFFIAHDRKAIFTHFFGGFSYLLFFYWFGVFIYSDFFSYTITLDYFFLKTPWAWNLIIITFCIMVNRILQRSIATYRIYGFIPGVTAVFRTLVSNTINMHSFFKAFLQFFQSKKRPEKAKWAKTKNTFPVHAQLLPTGRRLGDILIEKKLVTSKEIIVALEEQKTSQKKLGEILLGKKILTESELYSALSELYNTEGRFTSSAGSRSLIET